MPSIHPQRVQTEYLGTDLFRDNTRALQFGKSRSQRSANTLNCIRAHCYSQGWFIRRDGSQDGFYDAGWYSESFSRLGREISEESAHRWRVGVIGGHAMGGRREIRGKNPGTTIVTFTPRGASSRASPSIASSTAGLLAE
jgi:hypothetical protein